MTARLLTEMAQECRRIAQETEAPRVAAAMVRRARSYLDAARSAEPETTARRIRPMRMRQTALDAEPPDA